MADNNFDGFEARDSPRNSLLDSSIRTPAGNSNNNLNASSSSSKNPNTTRNKPRRAGKPSSSSLLLHNQQQQEEQEEGGIPSPLFCGPRRKRICKYITIILVLALFLAIGIVGVFGGKWIANIAMKSDMVLTSWKTELFNIWQNEANMNIVIYRKYYFFNLTNPYEVYFDRVAPDFKLIGPFTYKTNRARPLWSIFWDTEDDVNFRYADYQYWSEEFSKDDKDGRQLFENETITSINMALFTATYRVSKIPEFEEEILPGVFINKQDICLLIDLERLAAKDRAVGPKGVFTQRTVKEWLWGYIDPTLQMLHDGSKIIDYHVPIEFKLQFNDSVPAPGPISYRHGQVCPLANFEDGCNDTMNGDSASLSGVKWDPNGNADPEMNLKKVGIMTKWAGNDRFWWFGDEPGGDCQQIRGTEGLFLGANVEKTDTPSIFVDAVYRSVKLQYLRDSEVDGIPTYRFIMNQDEIELGPNSKCYDQFYYGAFLNLSRIAFADGLVTAKYMYPMHPNQTFIRSQIPYNPPYEVEMMNFTITDMKNPTPTHVQEILRTQATEESYSSVLDIHPLTGSTLQASSMLQINSILKPIDIDGCKFSFDDMMPQERKAGGGGGNNNKNNSSTTAYYTSYFPQTIFPVLLLDRVAAAPKPIVHFLKSHVLIPLHVLKISGYVCFGLFAIVLAVSLYVRFQNRRAQRKLENPDEAREREYLVVKG